MDALALELAMFEQRFLKDASARETEALTVGDACALAYVRRLRAEKTLSPRTTDGIFKDPAGSDALAPFACDDPPFIRLNPILSSSLSVLKPLTHSKCFSYTFQSLTVLSLVDNKKFASFAPWWHHLSVFIFSSISNDLR